MNHIMPDLFEVVSLLAALIGTACSVWAVSRTYEKQRAIRLSGVNGELKAIAMQRMQRHMLNLLCQLTILFMSGVAFWIPPHTETFQGATSRICSAIVSMILALKVILDRWNEQHTPRVTRVRKGQQP